MPRRVDHARPPEQRRVQPVGAVAQATVDDLFAGARRRGRNSLAMTVEMVAGVEPGFVAERGCASSEIQPRLRCSCETKRMFVTSAAMCSKAAIQ